MTSFSLTLKRLTDIAVSAFLLLVLTPVLAGVAGLIRLVDGPPVLFRQERVGRGGRPFHIVKFRTMRALPGAQVTVAGDPRITRLGALFRRTKLDELPQLWNVLLGQMSLVGPRPEVPLYVATAARAFRAIARLRPGITDWASLAFHDEERLLALAGTEDFYPRALLPRKLALARLYQRRRGWWLDLRLLAATACLVTGWRRGANGLAGPRLLVRARRGFPRMEAPAG